MKVDDALIKTLQEQAAAAREKVKDARAIPGKSEFRRAWVKHGPDDAELAIEIWQANRQTYEAARQQRARERESLARLQRIEKKGTSSGGASSAGRGRLQEEAKRLTAEKVDLDVQLREARQQHEAALKARAESHNVVSDVTSLRTHRSAAEIVPCPTSLSPLARRIRSAS